MQVLLAFGVFLATYMFAAEATLCLDLNEHKPFQAAICKTDADCGSGECCYIEPEFLLASKKRQLSLAPKPSQHDTGVCEAMLNAGDHCNVFAIINGHCGCPSGLSCKWVPDPTTAAPKHGTQGRRGMIPHNEPGSYKCA